MTTAEWEAARSELGTRVASALRSHDAWGPGAYAWWQFKARADRRHAHDTPTFKVTRERRARAAAARTR